MRLDPVTATDFIHIGDLALIEKPKSEPLTVDEVRLCEM